MTGKLYLLIDAEYSLFEGEGQVVAQVWTTARSPSPLATADTETEELLKYLVDPKIEVKLHSLKTSMAKTIVGRSPFLIREHSICLVDFFKAFLCPRFVIDIWVIFLG
jgi:hypothetical protein